MPTENSKRKLIMSEEDLEGTRFDPKLISTRRGMREESPLSNMTAPERAARLEEWKQAQVRRRASVKVQERQDRQDVLVQDRDLTTDQKKIDGPREMQKLTGNIFRRMLAEPEWGDICGVIKKYQDELKEITEELEAQGKPCKGCALKPYKAKFIKQLLEDFQDEEVVLPEEVANIKKILNVNSLHVGTRNGKAYVR